MCPFWRITRLRSVAAVIAAIFEIAAAAARYEAEFAKRLGKFRLERITKAVERFLGCGDSRRGIARIQCTNPDCRRKYFRAFSCRVFHLCPSCSKNRTLRLGEYMNERLLLRLPHRQYIYNP